MSEYCLCSHSYISFHHIWTKVVIADNPDKFETQFMSFETGNQSLFQSMQYLCGPFICVVSLSALKIKRNDLYLFNFNYSKIMSYNNVKLKYLVNTVNKLSIYRIYLDNEWSVLIYIIINQCNRAINWSYQSYYLTVRSNNLIGKTNLPFSDANDNCSLDILCLHFFRLWSSFLIENNFECNIFADWSSFLYQFFLFA